MAAQNKQFSNQASVSKIYTGASQLTNDSRGEKPHSFYRWITFWIKRLENVVSEGERSDGVPGRHDDQESHPEIQEGRKGAERSRNVRVVTARLGNRRA